MITVNIKIEGLDQLTEALALLASATAYKNDMANTAEGALELAKDIMDKPAEKKEATEKKETKKAETKKTEKPAEKKETKKEEVKKEEPKTESSLTREDVRAALVSKNSPSTREQLKAILDKYEAPNISQLKEEHFEDVMKELEAL